MITLSLFGSRHSGTKLRHFERSNDSLSHELGSKWVSGATERTCKWPGTYVSDSGPFRTTVARSHLIASIPGRFLREQVSRLSRISWKERVGAKPDQALSSIGTNVFPDQKRWRAEKEENNKRRNLRDSIWIFFSLSIFFISWWESMKGSLCREWRKK